MGQPSKPNGGPQSAGNRETLEKLARLISVGDDTDLPDNAGNDDDASAAPSPEEMAESLASLRQPGATRLLEALPAGLAVCEGGKLINANSAFALAFGYRSANDLRQAGDLGAVFPDELEALTAHLNNKQVSKDPIELKAHTRSGREFRIPVAIHAITTDKDETASLLVLHPHNSLLPEPGTSVPLEPSEETAADTDEETEARTKQALESEKTASQRHKRKKRKKRRKKSHDLADMSPIDKTGFLAKVSHEVRTPLNSIIGFAEIMKEEKLGPIGNDRYRGYIRDIYESGLYALSLVNDLLDISKIEAGEFELNFTAVNLDDVVVESVHSLQPQAQKARVLLRTSFEESLPPVLADRRAVKQIILNLVSNAIKFTRPGGQVIVSTQATGPGGVRLRVRDTGIGMSKDEIEVAMKPFHQVDTASRRESGTGLGLPLTKALVEANRAKFKLRSISEKGTRIDMTFPPDRVSPNRD